MKVAICTPCYGDPRLEYTVSLAALLLHSKAKAELRAFFGSNTDLLALRNALYGGARDWGADHILWLDADHEFPADTLDRLLSHKLAVVGANYPRRLRPTYPAAVRIEDGKRDGVWTTREKADREEVEVVHSMGLGVCLTSTEALRAIGEPPFRGQRDDTELFERLGAAGFPAHVDHWLSWRVGHVHTYVMTNELAAADKPEFDRLRGVARKQGT